MGCGASRDAQSLPIVPQASTIDTGADHVLRVQVSPLSLPDSSTDVESAIPSPPAPLSGAAMPTPFSTDSSRRSRHVEDPLPPIRGTPRSMRLQAHTPPPVLTIDPALIPPGSQIPGQNYCDPTFFPSHMEPSWNHYARPPEYQLIDKAGLKLLAEDAVRSFIDAARADVARVHPQWDESQVESRVDYLRAHFLPGPRVEDTLMIGTHYFAHEMKYQSGDARHNSGVTKPCFFLHFQRAHRNLFSYPGGDITLERELLVQRLNKQVAERVSRTGLRSITGRSSGSNGTGTGTARSRASSRHRSKRTPNRASKRENMFGAIDFDRPQTSIPEVDA